MSHRRPALSAPAGPVTLAGPDSGLIAVNTSFAASVLSVEGGVALSGAISAESLIVAGTLALIGAAALTVTGDASVSAAVLAEGGGARLSIFGTLTLAGAAAALGGGGIAARNAVLQSATLSVDAVSSFGVASPAKTGSLTIGPNGTIAGTGHIEAPVLDDGMIAAADGALALFGAVTGNGTLAIGAGGTLFAAAAVAAGIAVAFTGPGGTLDLFALTQGFAAPVSGFAPGDAIDIAAPGLDSAIWAAGTLTLNGGAGSMALAGDYTGQTFVPLPDGSGGSEIVLAPAPLPGVNGTDVTLGADGLAVLGGVSSVAALTIAGPVALTGTAAIGTLALNGTLALLPGAALTAAGITGAGWLVAEGSATLSLTAPATLAGTLSLLDGASAALDGLTLAGGAILIDAASQLGLAAASAAPGGLTVGATATLSGFGRIAAPLTVDGSVTAAGGALVLGAAASGNGSLGIGPGGTLIAFAPVSLPVTFGQNATLALEGASDTGTLSGFAPGDGLDIAGYAFDAATWASGTLSLLSGGAALDSIALAGSYDGQAWQAVPDGSGGTLIRLASGSPPPLDVTGTLSVNGTMSASAASIEPGGALLLAGGTLAASGLGVAAGGLVSGQGWIGATVDDGGTLQASGGLLSVSGAISGSGAVLIGGGAALSAPFGIAASVSVAFTGGNATLDLFGSAVSTGAIITGLGANPGNGIDLTGAAVTGAVYTDLGGGLGSLALTGPGGSLGALTLAGEDSGASAVIGSDGHGGSLIQLVPCFVAGARIATPDGPVPVERLRPGDLVLTPDGPRRLRWAGRRRCDGAAAAELRPVCIGQGALGGGLPQRDLWLSPRHAVMLGRMLVPAIALLNGGSIRRGPPGLVRYHHLGLDRHALLLAEGALAETWLPSAEAVFDWESGERPAPGPPCAPLLECGPALEAALRHHFRPPPAPPAPAGPLLGHIERIAVRGQRTRLEGWALDEAAPDRPVALLAHAGGQVLGCAVANLWRPDLDRAGLAGGRCGFALDLPRPAADLVLRRRADGQALPNSCADAI